MDAELGILGAGASGLSLALLTDRQVLLLEGASAPGGHALSTSVDGWVFDRGPHIMFSRDQLLLDCMVGSLGDNVHRCRRNNKVAVAGALARYPLENDLAALPLPLRSEALISLVRARASNRSASNLAEWFEAGFGEVLVATYLRPYNEKVWNVPLEELSMSWTERIPLAETEDVIRGALGELSEGYLHQLYYSYPLRGGYEAIMSSWASGLEQSTVVLDSTVTSIVPSADDVVVRTAHEEWRFEQVVSTVPLHELVGLVPDVPDKVAAAVERLVVNPMLVVTLGYEGEDVNQFTAVYIPDEDYLVNRLSFPSVFSPHNAPDGCFSVQAEITARRGSEVLRWSDETILGHVVEGIESRSLVPRDARRVFEWVERCDPAYVVYTQGYERDVELVREWFADHRIVIHGRFGSHQYVNVDGCLRQSLDLARRLGADMPDEDVLSRFTSLAGGTA